MASEKDPKQLDLYLKLAALLLWPCIVLFLLYIFAKPLKALVSELPNVVDKTQTVSIAGVTVKFTDELIHKPTPKVNDALNELDRSSLQELLELGVDEPSLGGIQGYDTSYYNAKVKPLTDNGLIYIDPRFITDTVQHDSSLVQTRLTKLGLKSSLVLADLFNAFVQELSKPKSTHQETEDE